MKASCQAHMVCSLQLSVVFECVFIVSGEFDHNKIVSGFYTNSFILPSKQIDAITISRWDTLDIMNQHFSH